MTGSLHALLGPLWSDLLGRGDQELSARQCSKRGGEVAVVTEVEEVTLTGTARICLKGTVKL